MKAFVLIAACGAVTLSATAAVAQVRSMVSSRATPIANTVVSTSPDGKVCKLILRTGSRLGERKICKSREEWDQIATDARRATERKQTFSWNEISSGGGQ